MTTGSLTLDCGADLEGVFDFGRNQYAIVPVFFSF